MNIELDILQRPYCEPYLRIRVTLDSGETGDSGISIQDLRWAIDADRPSEDNPHA